MATTHVIGSSNPAAHLTTTGSHSSSSSNIVGVHYKVGKKIGEGSFGVIFEGELETSHMTGILGSEYGQADGASGTNLLNSQTVAIKFVSLSPGAVDLPAHMK
jgi:casein kinase 1